MKKSEFQRGAEAAAAVASDYNSSSSHPYRLEDCILGKLNLRKAKPRKNKNKNSQPQESWAEGYADALAEVHRITGAACKVANFDVKDLKKTGIE